VDAFYERLILRAATIDELLSDEFEALPGQKTDADLAARRLAAWCQSCASGDWSLFERRLNRDRLSIATVLKKLATVRRSASAAPPAWIDDAIWIEAALQSPGPAPIAGLSRSEPSAFEHLFTPVVEQAETRLQSAIEKAALDRLTDSARADLRLSLLKQLSNLATPAIYELFAKARKTGATPADATPPAAGTARYDQFVAAMKAGGARQLFEDKPVLLRLLACVVRQWIDTSRELILRLDADLATIRRDIVHSARDSSVAKIEGDLSDPHNRGHSVQVVSFADGTSVVYKPKDMRVDTAWFTLIERLNEEKPPLQLKASRAIARDGYGWSEFIDHVGCADRDDCRRFFRRAGAWLALLHCFAATDMHQENMIAAGEQPVPIDLETILHAAADEREERDAEGQAFDAAMETVANSVMMVGLLPAYGRSPDNNVFAIGGMTADWNSKTILTWNNINSDTMRPAKAKLAAAASPNLPQIDGRYAKFGDHIEDFVSGFEDYARFLLRYSRTVGSAALLDNFAGLPVRTVIRPTRFYYMLLQRLKNHRTMDDGATWSAQADFVARLSEWEKDSDPVWPLHRAERAALIDLNVPHLVSPSDGNEIRDATGISIRTVTKSGMERASSHIRNLDEQDIAWQVDVIRHNTSSVARSSASSEALKSALRLDASTAPTRQIFTAEADRIAAELSRYAIRRGPGAAWIGLDWLGDAEVVQLVCLGPDLYNGVSGVAVFLAAHAAARGSEESGELARAAIAHLRKSLRSRNAARLARSMGIGGAVGLGSVVYALTLIAKSLSDDDLLADAQAAAQLFTDDLIAADKQLDVIGGSAGGILGLLRLFRDCKSSDVLSRATKCGEHLMAQSRLGPEGLRTWVGQGCGQHGLNGMSHGAAGFAYALSSLSAATGRQDFAKAARECIAFENSSYDAERHNWPDRRDGAVMAWPCQWCHGATGIGLARFAMSRQRGTDDRLLGSDLRNAVEGAERSWPNGVDTLCCGTLGSIEFFCEAGSALGRNDLRELAARRMMAVLQTAAATGDYRWNSGKRQFNLGLFRGLAGIGYTLLRQADDALPNVLIWE
jgi:type 2 lantibiotic biosynthesis protein LanM